jgi:hypothetical protein
MLALSMNTRAASVAGEARRCLAGGVLALLLAAPAWAEVMDKEPTTREVWTAALAITPLALVVGRIHPLLGVLLLWVPYNPLGILSEIWDPHVGPAILREAGVGYIAQAYASGALVLLAYLLGVALFFTAGRRKKAPKVPPAGLEDARSDGRAGGR